MIRYFYLFLALSFIHSSNIHAFDEDPSDHPYQIGQKRSEMPDGHSLSPERKRQKIEHNQSQKINHTGHQISEIYDEEPYNEQDVLSCYNAAIKNPEKFKNDNNDYQKLLKYIYQCYISIDLESLDLLPDIKKIDMSKDHLTDFDMHCLFYLILYKKEHILPFIQRLKKEPNDVNRLHLLGTIYRAEIEKRYDDDYKREVSEYIQDMEQKFGNSALISGTLFYFYIYGTFIKTDEKRAFAFCKKAAKQGHGDSLHNLFVLYARGIGTPQDDKKAFKLAQKLANNGLYATQHALANIYQQGIGIPKDDKKAFEYYKKAADRGCSPALHHLGICYEQGSGVEIDPEKAFECQKSAATQNNFSAQRTLGLMYFNGFGVAADYEQAFNWFQKAADQGDTKSYEILENMCRASGPFPHKEKELYYYFMRQDSYLNFLPAVDLDFSGFDIITNAQVGENKKYQLGLCIDHLLGITCYFEGGSFAPNDQQENHFGFTMLKKLFNRLSIQLTEMKAITKQFSNVNFMNPYLREFEKIGAIQLAEDRPEKLVGFYQIGKNGYCSLGKKENDLSLLFVKIKNEKLLDELLEISSDAINAMLPNLSLKQEPVSMSFVREYKAVKAEFINFVIETAILRNPLFELFMNENT